MENDKRAVLERIFVAGLQAVDPERAVHKHVQRRENCLTVGGRTYGLDGFRRVLVVGAGKATAPMARALEDILGDRLTAGWISVKYGHGLPLRKIHVMEAGHPLPDAAGVDAAGKILECLEACSADDLVVCAFSGGGSALLPAPRTPIGLGDKQETTRLLLECGANIQEINTIRKHLSLAKGGMLARCAYPATVVSLLLSDVVGDPLDVIASGPTAPDDSSFRDCLDILGFYGLTSRVSRAALKLLEDGVQGVEPETPKTGDSAFQRVQNVIVASNRAALLAACDEAASLGYAPVLLSSSIQGEAREVAQVFAAIGKEITQSGHPSPPPACVLAGGETTVTLKGEGKGGRNQELALSAAIALEDCEGITLLSAGTDGSDGPTDAAGAVVDGSTCRKGRKAGMEPHDFLARNDAYPFLDSLGLLLKSGPTRTNVMDMILLLVEAPNENRGIG